MTKRWYDEPTVREFTRYKCPECGALFTALTDGLIPTHDHPKPCRRVCPGSKQYPRNAESDKRKNWEEEE